MKVYQLNSIALAPLVAFRNKNSVRLIMPRQEIEEHFSREIKSPPREKTYKYLHYVVAQ